ncbi:MAG TPA: PH domain-containing protein [Candidatus Limnocylindrales bacterium]|nr:PH domain-containing protein [Candidatus Limnocylindrales bacterium]
MTRYADRLLADGERVALRGRQHVLATFIEGRVAWAIFIAALVLVLLTLQLEQSLIRDIFSWLGLILLLVGLGWLAQIYMNWYAEDYVITNRRVMKVEGLLKKRSADSSLEKINDAVLEQSVFGRMLGYGDLDILTANEQSVDRYRMLAEAQTFKRTMLDQKHQLEQEAFQIPAPPLRAPVPMPAVAADPALATAAAAAPAMDPEPMPAAPATPAARAEREMSSDEITTALGSLADLRDRGAITPEEFEAKKAELLGRL